MYAVAKLIRPIHRTPFAVMRNIRLSRAYLLPGFGNDPGYRQKSSPRATGRLDLLATFLDEDVELKDSRRLLAHSLDILESMSHFAPVVISTRPIPAIAENRNVLLDQLKASVDICWEEPLPLPADQELQLALF